MDQIARDVLEEKYLAPGEESPNDMWRRVAYAMASVEDELQRPFWYDKFYALLEDFKFVPGGRVMHGAGRSDARRRPTLSNCYVIPINEDSLEGIYQCITESALVYRTGGGVGTDLSILRPRGANVNATVAESPGATSFMHLFSVSTNTVSQAGRRGALMLTMRVDHPDIEDFVDKKMTPGKVEHANVSVLVTDEFMEAVKKGKNFPLKYDGETYRTVNARELWDKIIKNAHASAEPGIIFWDRVKEYHNVEYGAPVVSTNPCAEQPLAPYTACNLGSLNLSAYVKAGKFDYMALAEDSKTAVRFLDNVVTYNMDNHALERIKEAVANDRRIGLGITGLADALVAMGIQYDSEEALVVVDKIMKTIALNAYEESISLASEKGSFPLFDSEKIFNSKFIQSLPEELQHEIRMKGLRNGTVLTVPPVGTGSIVAECSSGIEPIFAVEFDRRVRENDGETFREYTVRHPALRDLFGDEELPEYVVTAHEIDPDFRVRLQATVQRWVDSSISSTINLPTDIDVETVKGIYWQAYNAGLKGVTVYREGSRRGVLATITTDSENCPECEGELTHEEGCVTCHGCGWSVC